MANIIEKEVLIRLDADLTVEVLTPQPDDEDERKKWERDPPKWIAFKVSRQVLIDKSQHFKQMLHGCFAERHQQRIEMKTEDLGLELWFRAWHGTLDGTNYSLTEVRNTVATADIFGFDSADLKEWYESWVEKNQPEDCDQHSDTLVPSYFFNDAVTFAKCSKYLVYNATNHSDDRKRHSHKEFHLPVRIFREMNAARGSLRVSLFTRIDALFKRLYERDSDCCKFAHWEYGRGLDATGCWPMEENRSSRPLSETLRLLSKFKYKTPIKVCMVCNFNYGPWVQSAVDRIKVDFDGLCLDCMSGVRPSEEFLTLSRQGKERIFKSEWSEGCRITHGEPTWYFSHHARPDEKDFRQIRGPQLRSAEVKAALPVRRA